MNSRTSRGLASLVISAALAACGVHPANTSHVASQAFPADYDVQLLRLASFDGTELSSAVYIPDPQHFPGPRPALILASSWLLNEFEYDQQARQFANDGYIVYSYATRGFGLSGGEVSVAGPNDVRDVSSIIDWLSTNTPADMNRIGMAGVSYGAGLALLAAAHDPRIKTAVALSGWGNLNTALAGNDSVRQVWVTLLMGTGSLLGRLGEEVYTQTDHLLKHEHVEELRAWARERSPEAVVDALNARKVPIFVANSYQDALFPPTQMRAFYDRLTGPKMFYMDRGIHASTAIPGLLGLPTEIWGDVHQWMDHWLMGADTDVIHRAAVSFGIGDDREYYADFPAPSAAEDRSWVLKPVNHLHHKGSTSSAENALSDAVIHLVGGIDSAATSGIPVLSDVGDGLLNLPVLLPINLVDKHNAAVYVTGRLEKIGRLRGSPHVKLHLQPHQGSAQLVAYLYDVDDNDIGTLVSHGVYTRYEAHPEASILEFDLAIAAYDLAAGHRVALVIDTRDPLYADPASDVYPLEIAQTDHENTTLSLPLVL